MFESVTFCVVGAKDILSAQWNKPGESRHT